MKSQLFSLLSLAALLAFPACIAQGSDNFGSSRAHGFLSTEMPPLVPGRNDAERWNLVTKNLPELAASNQEAIQRLFGKPRMMTPPGSGKTKMVTTQYMITQPKKDAKVGEVVYNSLTFYFESDVLQKVMLQPVRVADPAKYNLDGLNGIERLPKSLSPQ